MNRLAFAITVGLLAVGCSVTHHITLPPPATTAATPARSGLAASEAPRSGAPATTSVSSGVPTPSDITPDSPAAQASETPEPLDSGGSTTGGDIPDNAVFLTYHDASHGFSIDYVEGWQVTPQPDGVQIRDKDSGESVQVVPGITDVTSYISSIDLPQLQTQPGFTPDHQDKVGVNGQQLDHVVYHALAPPDPVTGKEVPSTIDRYYVPGPNGIVVVTLSTPDGVDNVDAFRQMIKSFTWG